MEYKAKNSDNKIEDFHSLFHKQEIITIINNLICNLSSMKALRNHIRTSSPNL